MCPVYKQALNVNKINISFSSRSPDLEDEISQSAMRDSPYDLDLTPVNTKDRDDPPPRGITLLDIGSPLDKDVTLTPGLTVAEATDDGADDDGDDMSADNLNIASETEEERLDKGLEEKSQNVEHVQLTVKNVRSIIHVSFTLCEQYWF